MLDRERESCRAMEYPAKPIVAEVDLAEARHYGVRLPPLMGFSMNRFSGLVASNAMHSWRRR